MTDGMKPQDAPVEKSLGHAVHEASAPELIHGAVERIALHQRLSSKFVVIVFLLSFAPLSFLYFFSIDTAAEVLTDSLRDDLKEKSYMVGANIDRFFFERELDVRILSQADVLEGENIDAIIQYLTEIIHETPYLDDIDVIDSAGVFIASSGEQNEQGKHVLEMHPELEGLLEAVQTGSQGQIFVSNLMELDGGPGLAFLTPITDNTNTIVVKTLLVEINLEVVARIVAVR